MSQLAMGIFGFIVGFLLAPLFLFILVKRDERR